MNAALLLVALSAHAAEPPPDPERPGSQRLVLGLVGTGAMAAAAGWFFYAGDSLGAGDPAALLAGAGLIGATGALLGAGATRIDPDESDLFGEASTPVVRLGMAYGGAAWAREKNANGLSIDVRPRVPLGRLRITPGLTFRQSLGSTRDIDWSPQADFTRPALTESERGIDLDLEFRTRVADHVDVIATPLFQTRWERFGYADGRSRRLQRSLWVPLAAGFRWRISGRQYFEAIAGPRWDQLSWGGEDFESGSSTLFYSPLYLSARYRIQFAHPDLRGGLLRSRFGIGYEHSNFDGQGTNIGASIGFMGPLKLDWDLRWTPSRGPAVQAGFNLVVADGGGIGFDIGFAPRGSAP